MRLLAAGIIATIAGLIIGIPSLRLRGDYLAIATLGFAEIIRIVFLNIEYVGGAAGMQVTHLTTWTYCIYLSFRYNCSHRQFYKFKTWSCLYLSS